MRRNRLSKNRKKNNSAARLYPSLECFCTVLGSSSSSSCFSQQKHRKPVRRCTALWPRNARNGSATLHHDQYPATVSFKTARTPWPESDILVCCSCRLPLIVFQQAAQPLPTPYLFLFSTDLSRQRE